MPIQRISLLGRQLLRFAAPAANIIAIINRTCDFWVTRAMVRERDSQRSARVRA